MDLMTLAAIIGIIAGIVAIIFGGRGLIDLAQGLWKRLFPPPPVPAEPEKVVVEGIVPQPPRRRGPVGFVARHDEEGRDLVEVVTGALGGDGALNLWGSGGVGKTTLAIEIAHHLLPSLPGGVIWADADGRAEFGLAALLDEVLTRLGREDARTFAPEAKASLACSLLGERRCLLAVDNFETVKEQEAILTFLSDVPCPVLVAGRKYLAPVRNVKIAAMSPDEAREFLHSLVEISPHRAKLEKVDLDEVAQVAERNPKVMEWVVAQLVRAMRPQDVFDDLGRGKGKAAERVFGRSFGLLDEDGQAALLALSLFVPDASREALAAVSGFEGDFSRANEAITDVAGLALLELADERVGLAGLTRRLARAWLARDERAGELVGRFISHFLAYAESHSQPTPEDFDALELERENIMAAMDYAHAAEDWRSVMRMRSALEEFLNVRGYWDEAIRRGEQAVEAARKTGDEWALAQFSGNIGTICQKRGEYDEARQRHQDVLEAFRRLKSDINVAVALHQLGVIAQHQGDYEEARRLFEESLEIKRKLGDQSGIAYTLGQLGNIAYEQGDYEEARQKYEEVQEISKQLGDKSSVSKALHQLGMIAHRQGDYEEARRLYDESLEIKRKLGDQKGIASSLHQLGNIAYDQGDYEEAKRLYSESLEIERKLGDQKGIAKTLNCLANIAIDSGDCEASHRLLNESLTIARQIGDKLQIAYATASLSLLEEKLGHFKEALALISQAEEIFGQLGVPEAERAGRDRERISQRMR